MQIVTELEHVLVAGWQEQHALLLELDGTDLAASARAVIVGMIHEQRWLVGCLQALADGRPPAPLDLEAQREELAARTAGLTAGPWRAVVDRADETNSRPPFRM